VLGPFDALVAASTTSNDAVIDHSLTVFDWVTAGAIFVVGIVFGRVLKGLLARTIKRRDSEHAIADVVGRMVGFVVFAGGFVYALAVLGVRLGPLVGALGIGGLAIALAAQTILTNFLASIILQVRRPFRRGDQISTGDSEGVVEDVDFRSVALRTFDGHRVLVPCAQVVNNPIVNYTTLGRRRTTLDVGISYDADPQEVCDLLKPVVADVPGVLERPGAEVWVMSFGDSAVNLVIRFWHAPDRATQFRVRSAVAVAVKRALNGAGVDIPFIQVTMREARELEPS
jgi:small-conductance mechanosensitive channel